MEIYELRYFLGVARFENIHRASESLHVSPASLSKAIARLEDELSTPLFSREGRNIRLTDHGRLFQRRASEIVQLEEAARVEIAGHQGAIRVTLTGPEVLLSEMGISLTDELRKAHPKAILEFRATDDESAVGEVERGEAHMALVTGEVPTRDGLESKIIAATAFQTVVGKSHPLFSAAKKGKTLPIEKVLEHAFVTPNDPIFGRVGLKQSLDGWRDDQFPRRVEYVSASLRVLEELVTRGRALAYLPDYYAERIGAQALKISGCPYTCSQKIRLVAKNPRNRSWMRLWF